MQWITLRLSAYQQVNVRVSITFSELRENCHYPLMDRSLSSCRKAMRIERLAIIDTECLYIEEMS